jgi:hypothetical protein
VPAKKVDQDRGVVLCISPLSVQFKRAIFNATVGEMVVHGMVWRGPPSQVSDQQRDAQGARERWLRGGEVHSQHHDNQLYSMNAGQDMVIHTYLQFWC